MVPPSASTLLPCAMTHLCMKLGPPSASTLLPCAMTHLSTNLDPAPLQSYITMILLLQHPVIKNCHLLPYNYALLLLKKGTPHFLPYQNQQMGSSRTLVHKKPCMKLSRVPVSRKVNLVLCRKFRDDPVGYDLAIPGNDRVPSYTPDFEECTVETSPSTLAILKNFKGTIMMICLAASSVSWFPTSSFPSICWWIHTFLFWRNLRKKSPSITPVIFLKPYVKLCHQWR